MDPIIFEILICLFPDMWLIINVLIGNIIGLSIANPNL